MAGCGGPWMGSPGGGEGGPMMDTGGGGGGGGSGPKDHALELALLEAYQDAFRSLKRAWDRLPDDRRIGLIPPPTEDRVEA